MWKILLLAGASAAALASTAAEAVTLFSYTGALQTYTVTQTGLYDLTALGAKGGAANGNRGGKGAAVGGRLSLTSGTVLNIIVGGAGGDSTPGGGGGGGGTGGGAYGGKGFSGGDFTGGDGNPNDGGFGGGGGGYYNRGGGGGGFAGGGGGGFAGAGSDTGAGGGGGGSSLAAAATNAFMYGGINNGDGYASVDLYTPPGGVPEPSSWAMLITGFGGIGSMLRRRRLRTA